MTSHDLAAARGIIAKSHYLIALTGAGISAASGIPCFRGRDGIWRQHDPALAHIDAFMKDPHAVWTMARELIALAGSAAPNPAHRALAAMEEHGRLKAVITQNVDGLQRRAGSRFVIELHGAINRLECLRCRRSFDTAEFDCRATDPACPECNAVLKPGMVFFGEQVPFQAIMEARLMASTTDTMLVIGTSAAVSPAAELPYIARKRRAKIIEINPEATGLTNAVTDIFLQGNAEDILPELE